MRANKTELRQMLLADQKRLRRSALLCRAVGGPWWLHTGAALDLRCTAPMPFIRSARLLEGGD